MIGTYIGTFLTVDSFSSHSQVEFPNFSKILGEDICRAESNFSKSERIVTKTEMSLMQSLPYKEYQRALSFAVEQCEAVAKLADLRNLKFEGPKKPGEILIKYLDRQGITVQQYRGLISKANTHTYYRPQAKIAILIGNEKYLHLSKLATPSVDCDTLASKLKRLGFIVVTLRNTNSRVLKNVLVKVFATIPEDSYCFIFYAGHGCELCNIKCMLSIDCPSEDITSEHFVTENFILREVAKCKPDLCVLLMDMCRVYLDRQSNPNLYSQIQNIEDYTIHRNLLIGYSTISAHSAYEVLQIECSHTIDINKTYQLRSKDVVLEGASQYAEALCKHLGEHLNVSALLDKVHEEVENAPKKQRPIKLQCGVAKRSLHDPVSGDVDRLFSNLQEISKEFDESMMLRRK